MRIDGLLPRWDFRERHRHPTRASPTALLTAATEVTWAEVTVMRVLMRVRSAGLLRLSGDRPIIEDMYGLGFTELDRTPDELVVGGVGRPWTIGGRLRPPALRAQPDPAAFFAAFDEPGWAKIVTNFRAANGELTTETRVLLTDARSRRAFRAYWLAIRPFSGLIRRFWLAAIARRASPPR